MLISEVLRKNSKIFRVLDIIAFDLVELNTQFYHKRILAIGVDMLLNSLNI